MSDTGAEMPVLRTPSIIAACTTSLSHVIKAKFDGKNCVRTEWLSKVFFWKEGSFCAQDPKLR